MLAWCSFYSVTAPSGNTLAQGRPERARTATTPHSGHGCGNSSSSHCSSFRSHAGSADSWRNVASAAPPSKSDTFIPATRPLRERALVSLPGPNFPIVQPCCAIAWEYTLVHLDDALIGQLTHFHNELGARFSFVGHSTSTPSATPTSTPRSGHGEDTTRPSPIARSRISLDAFLAEPSDPLGKPPCYLLRGGRQIGLCHRPISQREHPFDRPAGSVAGAHDGRAGPPTSCAPVSASAALHSW